MTTHTQPATPPTIAELRDMVIAAGFTPSAAIEDSDSHRSVDSIEIAPDTYGASAFTARFTIGTGWLIAG